MAAQTPQEVIELFAEHLNRGDIDDALDLYEPEATFAVEPGRTVQGPDAIRQALGSFAALEPSLSGTIEKTLCAGDVALVRNRWTLEGSQPDGQPIRMAGLSADVLRKDARGAWKIVIDDPWGGEAA